MNSLEAYCGLLSVTITSGIVGYHVCRICFHGHDDVGGGGSCQFQKFLCNVEKIDDNDVRSTFSPMVSLVV